MASRVQLFIAVTFLIAGVYGCAIYANLSFAVTNPAHFRFFPPFQHRINGNHNQHLGAEYFNIGQAIAKGDGFASPFNQPTGPTAWMPPVLPAILAGLLWIFNGDRDCVMGAVVFMQTNVLVATGLLVVFLARQTTRRLGAGIVAAIFVAGMIFDFRLWFQLTHDGWLVLLVIDLLIAGICWCRPLGSWKTAAAWGLFGGVCAMTNPIVGVAWGVLSLAIGVRSRGWRALGVTAAVAALTVTPWTIRNYVVFGRWIPVKSNLAYELYQSQCLQADGLIQNRTFSAHPYHLATAEGREYRQLGETAFLDRKHEQFWEAVSADPLDFIERIACRFFGVTLWYLPMDRTGEARRPWVLWSSRLAYPLPFLALLLMLHTALWRRLQPAQWTVIGVYGLYLLPYIGASFYERYGLPMLGVRILLVIWAADAQIAEEYNRGPLRRPDMASPRGSDKRRLRRIVGSARGLVQVFLSPFRSDLSHLAVNAGRADCR